MVLSIKQVQFKKIQKDLEKTIKAYDDGELALTSNEVKKLYSDLRKAKEGFLSSCDHDRCEIRQRSESDSDGYCQTYYYFSLTCKDCDQELLRTHGTGQYSLSQATDIHPLGILLKANPTMFSDEELSKVGVKRTEIRTVNYSWTLRGNKL